MRGCETLAGIKNIFEHYGMTPMDHVQGGDIQERDWQFRTRQLTPYCQICGSEIQNQQTDENGHKVDPEWERANLVHYRCVLKREQGR